MSVIAVLIVISLLIAIGFLIAFLCQYNDTYTPSIRMLFDDDNKKEENKDKQ